MKKTKQIKSYKVNFTPNAALSTDAQDLFFYSDHISQVTIEAIDQIRKSRFPPNAKFSKILSIKAQETELYKKLGFLDEIRKNFYLDGAIRLTSTDIAELRRTLLLTDSRDPDKNHIAFNQYINSLVDDFGYRYCDAIIFRGPKYYYMFSSLKLEEWGPRTSINNIKISSVATEQFLQDVSVQYNTLHQHLKIFSDYIYRTFAEDIRQNIAKVKQQLLKTLDTNNLNALRAGIASGKLKTGAAELDKQNNEGWDELLEKLEELRSIVNTIDEKNSSAGITKLISYLANYSHPLASAKIVFGLDVGSIIEKYATVSISLPVRKLLLGLLDAKMNILAFVQNISQILSNEFFLNTEYSGSLVFARDIVRNIKATCPQEFDEFKALQTASRAADSGAHFPAELDTAISMYMDVLLNNRKMTYMQILAAGIMKMPELSERKVLEVPMELSETLHLLRSFLQLLDKYKATLDLKQVASEKKKLGKGKSFTRSERHNDIVKQALNRVIRLYREENDPLVMIKAAQNSLNTIILKKFDPSVDVLHLLSVNYGGSLVSYYAKQVFLQGVKGGVILANTGSLIYSIYDVKNANSFSALTDYPYATVLNSTSIPEAVRVKEARKNWLLIFDDNTHSGQTLDNTRVLAKQSGFYDRIDLFPCRTSRNLSNYMLTLTLDQKINMIVNSALPTRQSRINSQGLRYKEILGSVVGNRLWKIASNRGEVNG